MLAIKDQVTLLQCFHLGLRINSETHNQNKDQIAEELKYRCCLSVHLHDVSVLNKMGPHHVYSGTEDSALYVTIVCK